MAQHTIMYFNIITIIYYRLLQYTMIYYNVLQYTIIYYNVLQYTRICYNILQYTIIYCNIPFGSHGAPYFENWNFSLLSARRDVVRGASLSEFAIVWGMWRFPKNRGYL